VIRSRVTSYLAGDDALGQGAGFRPFLPPLFLGLALHRRRFRVLELEPVLRTTGAVARPEPLRHDAFEAHLAGVPEYALAIVGEVLVQTQPRKAPTQQARERRLACLQRLAPQVLAIELEEVEGVEEDMLARRLAPRCSNTASPFSSQATASPSIRQERTLSRSTASTMRG
jgi:hypothetical protein